LLGALLLNPTNGRIRDRATDMVRATFSGEVRSDRGRPTSSPGLVAARGGLTVDPVSLCCLIERGGYRPPLVRSAAGFGQNAARRQWLQRDGFSDSTDAARHARAPRPGQGPSSLDVAESSSMWSSPSPKPQGAWHGADRRACRARPALCRIRTAPRRRPTQAGCAERCGSLASPVVALPRFMRFVRPWCDPVSVGVLGPAGRSCLASTVMSRFARTDG